MSAPAERLADALRVLREYVANHGYEVITMGDGNRSAVPMDTDKALAALDEVERAVGTL